MCFLFFVSGCTSITTAEAIKQGTGHLRIPNKTEKMYKELWICYDEEKKIIFHFYELDGAFLKKGKLNHATIRDINGKKYYLYPKDFETLKCKRYKKKKRKINYYYDEIMAA